MALIAKCEPSRGICAAAAVSQAALPGPDIRFTGCVFVRQWKHEGQTCTIAVISLNLYGPGVVCSLQQAGLTLAFKLCKD